MAAFETNLAISEHTSKCVSDYLENLGISPERFCGDIAGEDEMYHNTVGSRRGTDFAYFKYLESGRRSHDVLQQIYSSCFDDVSDVDSVLEFASGHGRATRFLIESIPREHVWTSDIYTDAMDWQSSYFGVNTIQSVENPDDFHCDRKFKVIFASSLFTHLPESLFKAWLAKLGSLLEDDGILCISVREVSTVVGKRDVEGIEETGIKFRSRSESNSLSTEIYGSSIVTDDFMRRVIAECISADAQFQHFRRAWYSNQDVYVITKRPEGAFPKIDLKIPPLAGGAQQWTPTGANQELHIGGWALDLNPGARVSAVEILVDGEFKAHAEFAPTSRDRLKNYLPGLEVDPVSWRVRLDKNDVRPESIVRIEVTSQTGSKIEYYATPMDLNPQPA